MSVRDIQQHFDDIAARYDAQVLAELDQRFSGSGECRSLLAGTVQYPTVAEPVPSKGNTRYRSEARPAGHLTIKPCHVGRQHHWNKYGKDSMGHPRVQCPICKTLARAAA